MKIAHVPYVPNMFDPCQNHMINMCQLEGYYGMKSDVLPSVYFFNDDVPTEYDLVHIHGIPRIEDSLGYMNFIKNLYLNGIKFVISVYNYIPVCQTALLQDKNRNDCEFLNCKQDMCLKSRKFYEFLKECNIFVYSDNLKKSLTDFGCKNIFKIPICLYCEEKQFIFSERKLNNSVGYFSVEDSIFDKEREFIQNVENSERTFRLVNIPYDSTRANVSALLLTNFWNSSFPYEIVFAMNLGIPVVANKNFKYSDFEDVIYIDFENCIKEIKDVLAEINISECKKMSYKYYNSFGPQSCLSYYDSYYRKIYEN